MNDRLLTKEELDVALLGHGDAIDVALAAQDAKTCRAIGERLDGLLQARHVARQADMALAIQEQVIAALKEGKLP